MLLTNTGDILQHVLCAACCFQAVLAPNDSLLTQLHSKSIHTLTAAIQQGYKGTLAPRQGAFVEALLRRAKG